MVKIFLIFIALSLSAGQKNVKDHEFSAKVAKKDVVQKVVLKDDVAKGPKAPKITKPIDTKVIKKVIKKRSKTSPIKPVNDSTAVKSTNKADIHYTDLIKRFDEESNIDDCNKEIKLKRYAVIDLNELLTSNVTSKLGALTDGNIDGETQFTPASTFAVNHCEKLFTFDNLKSKGYYVDDDKLRFPGDQPLQLIFNYVDVSKYVSGTTSSTSELPYIFVDGKGSRSLFRDTNYQLKSTISASKRSEPTYTVTGDLKCEIQAHGKDSWLHWLKNLKESFQMFKKDDLIHDGGGAPKILDYLPSPSSESKLKEGVNVDTRLCYEDSREDPTYLYIEKYGTDKLFIYCKNDFIYTRCAALGYFDTFEEAPLLTDTPINDIRTKLTSCFIKPNEVIFQQSRHEIDGELVFPDSDRFNAILNNYKSALAEDNGEIADPNIFAGGAFRYLNKNWPTKEEGVEGEHDNRVFIFPKKNSYFFTFPDLKPLPIKRIIEIMHDDCQTKVLDKYAGVRNWLDKNKEKMSVEYIKIRGGQTNLVMYISVNKHVTNKSRSGKEYYQLIPKLSFTRIEMSSIMFTIFPARTNDRLKVEKNEEHQILKEGDDLLEEESDEMLGSKFNYEVVGDDMRFDIESPSNRYAILGLKQTSPYTGSYEADAYGYLTPFESLNHLPLIKSATKEPLEKHLWLKVPLDYRGSQLEFRAEARMNKIEPKNITKHNITITNDNDNDNDKYSTVVDPIEDVKFQMMIKETDKEELKGMSDSNSAIHDTYSCVYTETTGKISDFINAVHEKPFFSQDWIEHHGIGITFSPGNIETTNELCNKNNYSTKVDLSETYVEITKEFEIHESQHIENITSLSANFRIELIVKLDDFISDQWTNILHLTASDKNEDYCEGCRLPSVFVTKNEPKEFYICQSMNNKEQECLYTPTITSKLKQKINLTIIQTQAVSSFQYSFQVYLDGDYVDALTNNNPEQYGNILVYAGNTWNGKYPKQPGIIHSLTISGGKVAEFLQTESLQSTEYTATPNLADTVWDWYHDGKDKNGRLTLTRDGKVKWNDGELEVGWSVNNDIATITFNEQLHRLKIDGTGSAAVLLKPKRTPPSKMIKVASSATQKLANTVWDWYNDGIKINGEVTLTDKQVKWKPQGKSQGNPQGSWSVHNDIVTLAFNTYIHRLKFDGTGAAVQFERTPSKEFLPSKMIQRGGNVWKELLETSEDNISNELGKEYMVTLEMKFMVNAEFTITQGNSDVISIKRKTDEKLNVCNGNTCKEANVIENTWTNIRISQKIVAGQYEFTIFVGESLVLQSTSDTAVIIAGGKVKTQRPKRNIRITAYPTKVGVIVNNLVFKCDKEDQKPCLFLVRGKDKDQEEKTKEIIILLRGWMSQNEMVLTGEAESIDLDIVPEALKIKPESQKKVRVEITKDSMLFHGDIHIKTPRNEHNNQKDYSYQAILQLNGDVISLHIKSIHPYYINSYDHPAQAIMFDNHLYLRFDEDMTSITKIEMNPEMCFGDPYKVYGIWTGKDTLSHVLFDALTPERSQFYACKEQQVSVPASELMESLGVSKKLGFLYGANIDDFCWAYFNFKDGENGYVEELEKTFENGFSYQGSLTTSFHGDVEYKLPMRGNKDQICVTMPILRWKNWENTELDSKEDEGWNIRILPEASERELELVRHRVESREGGMTDQVDTTVYNSMEVDAVIIDDHICTPTMRKAFGAQETPWRGDLDGPFKQMNFSTCVKLCYGKMWDQSFREYIGVTFNTNNDDCKCLKQVSYGDLSNEDISCTLKGYNNYPIEMFGQKDGIKLIKGPKMCYIFNQPDNYYAGKEQFVGELTGHLKTFLFEIQDAKFIGKLIQDNQNQNWIHKFVLDTELHGNPKMFNGDLHGYNVKLILEKRPYTLPSSPTAMKMSMELDMVVGEGINKQVKKILKEHIHSGKYLDEFQKGIKFFEEYTNKLKDKVGGTKLIRSFQRNSIDRARAIKSYKRDCPYECGYAKVPGWTIEDSCSKKRNHGTMSCLKYKNDANIASNVGCIANCEAERARSFVDAQELHKRTLEVAKKSEVRTQCKESVNQFIDFVKNDYISDGNKWTGIVTQLQKDSQEITVNIDKIHLKIDDHFDLKYKSLRCHDVDITYTIGKNNYYGKTDQRKTLCFDGLSEDLAILVQDDFKKAIVDKNTDLESFDELTERYAAYQQFHYEKKRAKERSARFVKQFFKKKNKLTNCLKPKKGMKKRMKMKDDVGKRSGTLMSGLTRVNWNDFSDYEQNTIEAFQDTSPWAVAKRRNIITEFSKMGRNNLSSENITTPTDDGSCMSRKRTLDDYTDIASYIQKWTEEHKKAKRELNSMDIANNNLKFRFWNVTSDVKNYTDDDVALMNYWQSQSKNGMKEWFQRESEMLDVYNKESLPLIRQQLNYMYTNEQHKTLREFFDAQSSLEKKNVQRQQIANSSVNTFTDLGKSLIEILDKGKTLEEIAAPIEDILRHTDQLQKRSIPC